MPEIHNALQIITAIGWQIAILVVVGVLRVLGIDVFTKAHKSWNLILLIFRIYFHRPLILLYTDCDEEVAVTHKLAHQLRPALEGEGRRLKVVVLRDSEALLRWPLLHKAIIAIVILVTDVTRLSINPRRRDMIQRHLVSYCQRGGIIILGHDLLYRRVQNTRLQRLAGTRLVKFEALPNGAKYVKLEHGHRASSNRLLLDKLPDSFVFDEPEILTGSWAGDAEFIYVLEGTEMPLVTRRTSGSGCVFWVNVGDQVEEGPPKPIARPAQEFINILTMFICFGLN